MNAALPETLSEPDWDDDDPAEERDDIDDAARMRADDVAWLESLQGMAMSFATWLHDKGAEEMEKDGDRATERVRQLSGSFNKAASAGRRILVLKHEVAGLRPMANARAVASTGRNPPAQGRPAATIRPANADRRDKYDDYIDNMSEEERGAAEARIDAWVQKLIDALDVDLETADPEIRADAERQSIAIKLTRIASEISHPTLDKAIVAIEMGKLWDMWGPKNMERPESIGPPEPL
jgi:hypothetical protein